jgi:hypothetical protein
MKARAPELASFEARRKCAERLRMRLFVLAARFFRARVFSPRHCERSEAIQSSAENLDCFVASLLAMMTHEAASARPFTEARSKWRASGKKGSGTPADALFVARTQAACGTRHGVRRLAPPSACGRARLPAFHLRFSPTGLSSRGLSVGPGFPKAARKLRRAARIVFGYSDAPRAPVIVPAGMMPEPPGVRTVSFRPRAPHSLRRQGVPSLKASFKRARRRRLSPSVRQSQSALNFRR